MSVGHLGELSDIFLQSHMKSRAIPATLTATFEEEKKDYPCALRASKNFYSSNQFASQSEFLFQHPVRCFQGKGAVIGLNKPFRLHNAILPPFTHTGEVILNMADTEESFKSQQANVIQTFFSLVVMRFLAISANCRGSLQTVLKIF